MTAAPTAPPVAPPPPRPAAPVVVVRTALAVGVAAAVLVVAPPGIGVPVFGALTVALLAPLVRDGWTRRCIGLVAAALALLSVAAVRDAPWVVALDVLAAGCLAGLAVLPWRSWPGTLRGLLGVWLAAPGATGWLLRGARSAAAGTRWQAAGPALRGAALATLLLVVFVPLLVSADAAFGDLLARVVPTLPRSDEWTARLVLFGVGAALAAAAARLLVAPPAEPVVPPAGRTLTTSEWLLPLGALTALLAAFVAQQVLVDGRDAVLTRAGLTYAEHARAGFGQLLVVTALVLAVVAAAARWTPGGRGVRGLLGALCVLALLIDASALVRLRLYVEEYGPTRLRVLAALVCVELAVVLLLVLLAGSRRLGSAWLPTAVVWSGVAALALLSAADPDARIARAAVERGDRADLAYVSTLSADAVPVLARLPEPDRSCALAPIAARLDDGGWASANLSRARARDLLAGVGVCGR